MPFYCFEAPPSSLAGRPRSLLPVHDAFVSVRSAGNDDGRKILNGGASATGICDMPFSFGLFLSGSHSFENRSV